MTSDTGISTREIKRIARGEVQQAFTEDLADRKAATGSAEHGGVFVFLSRKAAEE